MESTRSTPQVHGLLWPTAIWHVTVEDGRYWLLATLTAGRHRMWNYETQTTQSWLVTSPFCNMRTASRITKKWPELRLNIALRLKTEVINCFRGWKRREGWKYLIEVVTTRQWYMKEEAFVIQDSRFPSLSKFAQAIFPLSPSTAFWNMKLKEGRSHEYQMQLHWKSLQPYFCPHSGSGHLGYHHASLAFSLPLMNQLIMQSSSQAFSQRVNSSAERGIHSQ